MPASLSSSRVKKRRPLPAKATPRYQRLFWLAMAVVLFCGCWFTGAALGWRPRLPDAGQLAVAASANAGLRLNHILIGGRVLTSPDDILAALQLRQGEALLGINLTAAQSQLQQLPWVEKATLQRRWPDSLIVTITERRPAARWQTGGQQKLVDLTGAIVPVDAGAFTKLPLISGTGATAQVRELLAVWQATPALRDQLVDAVWVGNRRWDMHLKNNVTLKLPEGDLAPITRRLAQLMTDYQLLDRDVVTIDLRLPGRLVLERATASNNKTTSPQQATP